MGWVGGWGVGPETGVRLVVVEMVVVGVVCFVCLAGMACLAGRKRKVPRNFLSKRRRRAPTSLPS